MKKKVKIIIPVVVMLILLTPIRMNLKDGGSVRYKALLYEVTKIHQLDLVENDDRVKPYIEGLEIKILGMRIYKNTWNESTNDTQ